MATVRLSDVVVPAVYETYQSVDSPEKTAFFESGVAVTDEMLTAKASTGGNLLDVPFWNDIDPTLAPNLSSDDPTASATPNKITAGTQIARMAYLNQAFSTADLAGELAGSMPMQHIRNRFGRYWMRQWQRRVIATLEGVLADNVAANGGDMVEDVSGALNSNVSASTLFSRSAFTGAAFTLGDAFEGTTAMAVHSVVYKRMIDNDDIEYIPDSQGAMTIPTFLGRRVIVDDSLPVTPAGGALGTDTAPKYTSILFGEGAIGYGEGSVPMATEVERQALQGNGGGVEYLIERKSWLLHPFGYQCTGTPAANSLSLTELKAATTWSRVVPRKSVPISFLITNG